MDYLLTLSKTNTWIITRLATGTIPLPTSILTITGKIPSATAFTAADIIGGIDINTGKDSGLEVIEDVFQLRARFPVSSSARSPHPTRWWRRRWKPSAKTSTAALRLPA